MSGGPKRGSNATNCPAEEVSTSDLLCEKYCEIGSGTVEVFVWSGFLDRSSSLDAEGGRRWNLFRPKTTEQSQPRIR